MKLPEPISNITWVDDTSNGNASAIKQYRTWNSVICVDFHDFDSLIFIVVDESETW
jgi:hypothetical protein